MQRTAAAQHRLVSGPRPANRLRRGALVALGLAVVGVAASASLSACSQTPTSVPVRTFERAQRMDVACMQLYDAEPNGVLRAREPLGRPQAECTPVSANSTGADFQKQLFALVTQSTRGELAVVDLSAGVLIDQSRAIPGINFIPVGALPTDVATSPDGKMAFVGSAETNKAAIYGIPTRRILGDTAGFPHDSEPATLASWPVCALPQNPGAVTIVPRKASAVVVPSADAGAGDAGAVVPADLPDYEVVVVLPGDRRSSAKILTLDPRPFMRGGLPRTANGQPDYARDPSVTVGPVLAPGSLADCPILSAKELSGASVLPTSLAPGSTWDDGVKYVDGGVDDTCNRPTRAARCGAAPCCVEVIPDGGVNPEGGVPPAVPDAGTCQPVTAEDAGVVPLDLGPLEPPRLASVVRDEQMLYVADESVPLIHVLDMSVSGSPRELPPLLATSLGDPARVVKVKELAISPPTRDYKRFLYAVDRVDGSIMVFDVTDPATMQRTPQRRPHAELNPFQPPDRISFSSPVVAVAFARHDVPLAQINGVAVTNAASGLLCNPNPNLDANPLADLGVFYRANSTDPNQDIGPRRLRGIFAFATLSNGQVITIDVDDWDSPCRRPSDMSQATSDLAPAQPAPSSPGDFDPYHVPLAGLAVTNEGFFPMTSPHSLRSAVLVRDEPTTGNQLPRLQTQPTLRAANGVLVNTSDPTTPLISVPSFAREVPQVHIDQDWTVGWEGSIPGFEGVSGVITTDDAYASLVVSQPNARFCAKGVEDWAQGTERAQKIAGAYARTGFAPPSDLGLITDYVQLTEDILPAADDYWNVPQDCWDPQLSTAAARHNACQKTFGAASDQSTLRDFPILEAYDDKVVLGRYFTRLTTDASGNVSSSRREVVYKDPSNANDLKLMRCCFHNQVRFRVRTGQLWSVVGTAVGGGPGVGFFSHMTTDAQGRCVASCDSRESLLNARAPMGPFGIGAVARNSPLGVRNPMFNFFVAGGIGGAIPARDTQYTFSTRGQFSTLGVAIGGSSISVNPQSMRYIESLGQIGVVDGASQGLVLIDLRAVTVARAPYF
jgi:hypothetical protein